MNFYNNFIITSFIIFYIETIVTMRNPDLIISNANLDTVFPTSTGLVFAVVVNNTSNDDYNVELTSDRCCLAIRDEINCDLLEVIGTCVERVPRGTTKTMKLVAPILDPFERVGHCLFHLDSKSSNRRKKTMRNRIKINFDTRLKNRDQSMIVPRNVRNCDGIDEDPLNDCHSVDCETFYNGRKSYFDRELRKCRELPACLSDKEGQTVYDSASNKCLETIIKKDDIDFVKQLLEGKERTPKDILIIKNVQNPVANDDRKPNKNIKHTTVSSTNKIRTTNLDTTRENKLDNLIEFTKTPKPSKLEKLTTLTKYDKIKFLDSSTESVDMVPQSESMNFFYFNNLFRSYSVNVLGIVVMIQCCCIFAMLCFLPKSCMCKGKNLVKEVYNYKHDASVTTPLIATSNIDTETTNYTSESTNIDKKIKCYKACQKDINIKMSMSDDILSKCVTRRDWNSKSLKCALDKTNSDICKIQENIEHEPEINMIEEKLKTIPETKVDFREEESKASEREKKSAICKSIFRKLETKSDSEDKTPKCDSSEKEIQSHIYTEEISKDTCPQTESVKNYDIYKTDNENKNAYSLSTEKGAQAEFSNDTIDDFLSERGMIYIAGDDLSKLSFSSSSEVKKSSVSSASSKTSKNNIVKHIFSIFRRNSKAGRLSDPGITKSGHNLELLHMSHASLYSSSNNGSEYLRCLKKMKDSRTSL